VLVGAHSLLAVGPQLKRPWAPHMPRAALCIRVEVMVLGLGLGLGVRLG